MIQLIETRHGLDTASNVTQSNTNNYMAINHCSLSHDDTLTLRTPNAIGWLLYGSLLDFPVKARVKIQLPRILGFER